MPKILAGKVEMGWTRDAIRESLGEPSTMMKTPTEEMWSYPTRKVIFTNDKVTYVGT